MLFDRVILTLANASKIEEALNMQNIKVLSPIITDLRQHTLQFLLFRNEGKWKESKRIDRYGNYVTLFNMNE